MNLTTISIAAGITRATSDSKHFVVDRERGVLVEEEMSLRRLEQFAREQGAIEPWEELERPFCTPPPPEDDDDEGARLILAIPIAGRGTCIAGLAGRSTKTAA